MNIKAVLIIFVLLFALSPKPVFAAPNTDFSACVNPQGTMIADYSDGTHGIVTNTGTYSGSDKVYLLTNGNAMQCYCGSNNEGIQTNWLKNTGFSDAEVSILKNQGWTSIPDGSVWGLSPVQYFAMNSSFACAGSSNGGSTGTSNGSSSSSTNPSSVLGASTTVLTTLATTGDSLLFFLSIILGIGLITIGLFLPGSKKATSL